MFTMSVIFLVLCVGLLITAAKLPKTSAYSEDPFIPQRVVKYLGLGLSGLSGLFFVLSMMITVPAGHSSVGRLFGEIYPEPKYEGLHFVNPLSDWHHFDCRQKQGSEPATVQSMDQLRTKVDTTVKFRISKTMTPKIYGETGTADDLISVHLRPKFRSLLREMGKGVKKAEDFFDEKVQARLQEDLLARLSASLAPHGIEIQEVLLRDMELPPEITRGVEQKKLRDQKAEQEKAKLRQFETQQQQKVAAAEAEKQAALLEAAKIKTLADAQAYKIRAINTAVAKNPAYIQLEAIKAWSESSKDPSAKFYIMDGKSDKPFPFMNIGNISAAKGK